MKTKHEFDSEKHEYTINGFRVPSVTGIIDDLLPGHKADQWYMDRGTANHACYALLAQEVQFSADTQSECNIRAWKAWRDESKPEFELIETQVFSDKYRFAGTLDALAMIPAIGELVLIDYKESLTPTIPYQLGGYAVSLKEEKKIKVKKGIGVELTHKGTWKMTTVYDLDRYSNAFLQLLSVYNIRQELGKAGK